MAVRNDWIEGLDIPEADRELLRQFEGACWEDIYPERCQSEAARLEAENMLSRRRRWAEHSCGID